MTWNRSPKLLVWDFQLMVLILSPPCTVFSELQRLWNIKRIAAHIWAARWAEGMVYIEHSMAAAEEQCKQGRFFVFEHPERASSWNLNVVKRVRNLPGVMCVVFDQCELGLSSKIHKIPIRKRTRIMSNSIHIIRAFQSCMCRRTHVHQVIEGSEGGIRRSVWAQKYPPEMVKRLVDAVLLHKQG